MTDPIYTDDVRDGWATGCIVEPGLSFQGWLRAMAGKRSASDSAVTRRCGRCERLNTVP
jgi:hypothetical protein